MSFLDDLREVGRYIDGALLPTINELAPLLGALLHLKDHPDLPDAVRAAKEQGASHQEIVQSVSDVISPPPPREEQAPQSDAEAGANVAELTALRAQVAELSARLDSEAAQRATSQQTQVEHQQAPAGFAGTSTDHPTASGQP